jgi:two-component system response regulator DesR
MNAKASCVLLGEPHPVLAEGLRGLLETIFDVVVMVADEQSLVESAERLAPGLAIVELALGRGDIGGLIRRLRSRCPGQKVLVLSTHGEPNVAESAIRAGADDFLLTRNVASDLLPTVEGVLRGERYSARDSRAAASERKVVS